MLVGLDQIVFVGATMDDEENTHSAFETIPLVVNPKEVVAIEPSYNTEYIEGTPKLRLNPNEYTLVMSVPDADGSPLQYNIRWNDTLAALARQLE